MTEPVRGSSSSLSWHFENDLEYSARLSDEGDWVGFYQRLYPDLISAVRIDADSAWQRHGVDRVLFLRHGRQVCIDEKKRRPAQNGHVYRDVLLEDVSVGHFQVGHLDAHDSTAWNAPSDWEKRPGEIYIPEKHKVGWALDSRKQCDYIAYCVPALQKCYLLPFEILRITFTRHLAAWRARPGRYPKYTPNPPSNPRYWTRNVAVDWPVLRAAMGEEMERRFGGSTSPVPLPVPQRVGPQMDLVFSPTARPR